ncbi:ANTAR domain-containing protein [Streptomyces sp. TRM 70361]|uniref:ANTAR domain-containing protein n=1 Tax=Streptomyces sp. TRM 70361 TaxID=3116553 RepID=UPI002E7B9C5E|nr:ANTAR domain-containing protein [Streptomyces sp. TRM 70361]MEE1942433.1 ANTAR domain-containing protein [Streptomyces sp. TRM 70361]
MVPPPSPNTSPTNFEAVFHATTAPLLVLDTGLVIRDVNRAYAAATLREREELIGQHVFDAFPDNPHVPEADGVRRLNASFRRVLERGRPDPMPVQRYDVPFAGSPTGFREKYWSPVNSPLPGPGREITGLLHHVEDVTGLHEELVRVERAYLRTETPTARTHTASAQRGYARHLAQAEKAARRLDELQAEVDQLRRALRSRAVIDQAIGIVQAERRCGTEDAFQILVNISQRTNVKLRDIAAALVRRAEAAQPGTLLPRDTLPGRVHAPRSAPRTRSARS